MMRQRERVVQILVPEVLKGAIAKLGSNENGDSTADACRRAVGMKGRRLGLALSPQVLGMSVEVGQMIREIRRSVRGLVDHRVSWEVLGKERWGTVQVGAA
jgi:hypothetical protein